NPFGEQFNLNGFQIPGTEEGEIKKKRKIGKVILDKSFMNIFAARFMGNFVEVFDQPGGTQVELAFPRELELFLAGTLTQDISYFIHIQAEAPEISGLGPGEGEEAEAEAEAEAEGGGGEGGGGGEDGFAETGPEFVLGRSFFVFNLGTMTGISSAYNDPIVIGPMLRIGLIDPSTFFSFPTERHYIKPTPGRVKGGRLTRFTLASYAIASKFYGMKTAGGNSVEVTSEVLYNGESYGIDLTTRIGPLLFQTGIMQGLDDDPRDVNSKKDPYVMLRFDFGGSGFFYGHVSAFANWGVDTGMIDDHLINWFRNGFGARFRIKHLDIYGAYIQDKIELEHTPSSPFDVDASGLTVEADYLITDQTMLVARYNQMDAGGFVQHKTDGENMTLMVRYYIRDNLGIYVGGTRNLKAVNKNPIRNYRNLYVLGVDWDW
ncbi:MAG: hypothetical protein ACE5FY_02150, partial [Nitrospiria bacterium]